MISSSTSARSRTSLMSTWTMNGARPGWVSGSDRAELPTAQSRTSNSMEAIDVVTARACSRSSKRQSSHQVVWATILLSV